MLLFGDVLLLFFGTTFGWSREAVGVDPARQPAPLHSWGVPTRNLTTRYWQQHGATLPRDNQQTRAGRYETNAPGMPIGSFLSWALNHEEDLDRSEAVEDEYSLVGPRFAQGS